MSFVEWYEPQDIRYTRDQVLWLIEWLPLLLEGIWPPDPRGTGYTDEAASRSAPGRHAPFETPEQIAGEIEARLKTTREAGEALVDEIQNSKITNYEDLSRPARRALNYISGRRRRRQTYSKWKTDQDENRKFAVSRSS